MVVSNQISLIYITFGNSNSQSMHEFSIAVDIIDLATSYARKESVSEVKEIEIEVGQLSGVVIEALAFSLEVAVKGTTLEKARRNLVVIPGRARCTSCGHEFDTGTLYTPCPLCQAPSPSIIQGRELRVKSLTVE